MPSRNPAERLNDILDNIGYARDFVSGMTFAAFAKNLMVRYAVARAIEIISEASRRLPEETKSRMAGIRKSHTKQRSNEEGIGRAAPLNGGIEPPASRCHRFVSSLLRVNLFSSSRLSGFA